MTRLCDFETPFTPIYQVVLTEDGSKLMVNDDTPYARNTPMVVAGRLLNLSTDVTAVGYNTANRNHMDWKLSTSADVAKKPGCNGMQPRRRIG